MPGGGQWQPCVKGILSGEIAKLSRPWRPPHCRERHQQCKPQYTHDTRGDTRQDPPRFEPKVHIALVEGQHRGAPLAFTVGLTNDPRTPVWPYRLNPETW